MTVATASSKRTSSGRRGWIIVGVIVGTVIALNLAAQGLDRAVGGNEPTGVAGSSYATNEVGLAAYSSLLHEYGHPVSHQRGPITDDDLDPDTTVIVLEPQSITTDDVGTLLQFVTNGGRLVIGGSAPYYLGNLRDRPPRWSSVGADTWVDIDPSLGSVTTISGAALGSWADPGNATPLVGSVERSLLVAERVGQGEVLYLADVSPIANAYLDEDDNAAFGLALAGDDGRPVIFAEGPHGYGRTRGIAALPRQWKISLLLLAVAALVFVWSRERFGPPDRAARDLPPARAEYVEALAMTLERTHDRAGAFASVQQFAREQVARRAGLPSDASVDTLAHAATTLGCTNEEVAALVAPVTNDEAALALGRVTARMSDNGRNT